MSRTAPRRVSTIVPTAMSSPAASVRAIFERGNLDRDGALRGRHHDGAAQHRIWRRGRRRDDAPVARRRRGLQGCVTCAVSVAERSATAVALPGLGRRRRSFVIVVIGHGDRGRREQQSHKDGRGETVSRLVGGAGIGRRPGPIDLQAAGWTGVRAARGQPPAPNFSFSSDSLIEGRRRGRTVARMLADVVLHFSLEAIGALGLRCVLAVCRHAWQRVAVWAPFGLLTSWCTVALVG